MDAADTRHPHKNAAFDGTAARRLVSPDISPPPLHPHLHPHLHLVPPERRRSDRVDVGELEAWVSVAAGRSHAHGHNVRVRDVALDGIGFTSDRPHRVGDVHWVVVRGGCDRLSTRMRVTACVADDAGGWVVGGEFF